MGGGRSRVDAFVAGK
ncbi:hypothetical protein VCHC67A1_00231A, partial [Vibrio cholerae HC-67A1]